MIKACVICGNKFNALSGAKACSPECSKQRKGEMDRKLCAAHPERGREYKRRHHIAHGEEERQKDREYRATRRKEQSEQQRKYRLAHPDRVREARRKYDATHRKEASQKQRKYRLAHPERVLERERKWESAHPEYWRAYCATERGRASRLAADHNRRAKTRGIKTTGDMVLDLRSEFLGFCPYCWDKIEKGHIDHIVPVSKGGTNERMNLVWACATCNHQKGNKSLPEFRLFQEISARVV